MSLTPIFVSRLGIAAASVSYAALLVVTRGRPTVESDAGVFLTVAGRLLEGDRLYVDVLDNKDPLFFYVHAAALSIGDWRLPFALDVIWVAIAAASILLLLRGLGASQLTAWVGFVSLPLLLTGTWYYAGYSMLAALSLAPLIGWLWLRRHFSLAGGLICIGMLFKVNLALVLISAPAAFLLLRIPVGSVRSQLAWAGGGYAAAASVAAGVLAIRGELPGYVQTLLDNVAYSQDVLTATGRASGIPGHVRDAAADIGGPLHFAVVAVIFVGAGALAVRALRGAGGRGERDSDRSATRLLGAVFLAATVAVSVTLALTAAWREHGQMIALPATLLIAFLVATVREPSASWPKTVGAYGTAVLTFVLLGGLVGGFPTVQGSISSTWGHSGRSETAELLERTADSRTPRLDRVTFAHLGQNDDRALGAFLDSRFAFACPSVAEYVFTPDLPRVVDCIEEEKPGLVLVTDSFRPEADAPDEWNRFVSFGMALLRREYELVSEGVATDGNPFAVWMRRTGRRSER